MAERPRIILHAGMHKTGSTAIQEMFGTHGVAGVAVPGVAVSGGPRANLSDIVLLLFAEGPLLDKIHAARWPHLSRRAPLRARARSRDQLAAQIAAWLADGTAPRFLVSAEDISAPDFDHAAVARMAAFFDRFGAETHVHAYVRAPASFMQSAFQQRVKQEKPGAVDLDAANLWPRYRARFEPLDDVFGPDRVHLRAFDPDAFTGGDVVADFAGWLGVGPVTAPPARANDGLSCEAVCVVFCRLAGLLPEEYPAPDLAARFRATPARALAGFGTRRFAFSRAFLDPARAAQRADLDWIEARLGQTLPDRRLPDRQAPGAAPGSAADMRMVAETCRDDLCRFLAQAPPPPTGPRQALTRLVRRLRTGLRRGLGRPGEA